MTDGSFNQREIVVKKLVSTQENPVVDAIPIMKIWNLEWPKETWQITTVVRNKNVTLEGLGEDEREISQNNLKEEELEIEEFEAFKSFEAMRKGKIGRNEWKTQKEKEWELVSMYTSQTRDSDETTIIDNRNEEKLSKKEVSYGPSRSKKRRNTLKKTVKCRLR